MVNTILGQQIVQKQVSAGEESLVSNSDIPEFGATSENVVEGTKNFMASLQATFMACADTTKSQIMLEEKIISENNKLSREATEYASQLTASMQQAEQSNGKVQPFPIGQNGWQGFVQWAREHPGVTFSGMSIAGWCEKNGAKMTESKPKLSYQALASLEAGLKKAAGSAGDFNQEEMIKLQGNSNNYTNFVQTVSAFISLQYNLISSIIGRIGR
ncbi:hypothetical protein PQR05_36435 [Paraburkholderia sediminicola]|uniref:hypothetical protein n=1 Tax=Paraburkholderia sediminicola TaxID=458836 RepID=UPI0038BA629B